MSSPRVVPLVDSILEEIGVEIIIGAIAGGEVFTLRSITDRFGVSRTVAREMMRSLEDLSLVEARPRVGITVLPATSWNVFSPRVVAWRLRCQQGALAQAVAAGHPAEAELHARALVDEVRDALSHQR